jgi:hypothetical protein
LRSHVVEVKRTISKAARLTKQQHFTKNRHASPRGGSLHTDPDYDPYESCLIHIGRGTIPFPRDMDRVPGNTDRVCNDMDIFAT